MSSVSTAAVDVARLEKDRSGKLVSASTALAAVGVLLGLAAAFVDGKRFGFSYLVGFMYVTTLGLGGLFFVLIQHLTKAGWSVAPRRHMEWMAGILPFTPVLFIPVAIWSHDIFHHWMDHETAAADPIVSQKTAYLNTPFFFVRSALYFLVWAGTAWFFTRLSRQQDESGDPKLTLKMERLAPVGILLLGLTTTFASFDWLMSLDPHWFSTIFGVYIFAGAMVSALALLSLITVGLQNAGVFKRVSTVEHRHDIGKLLFGFVVFWAYIGFCQYFLIWYANIPEETWWYIHRWEGSWKAVSITLAAGHFAVPFILLLSRHTKRNGLTLTIASILLLTMHYVDLYWLVMPTLDAHGAHFSWIDVAGFLAPVGVLAFWIARRLANDPLYPLRDPRLDEAARVENL